MSFCCRNRCRLSQSNGNGSGTTIGIGYGISCGPKGLRKDSSSGVCCGDPRCTDGDGGCAAVTCNRCMSFCCRNRCRLSQSNGNGSGTTIGIGHGIHYGSNALPKDSRAAICCCAARCTDGDGGCAAVTCNRC